MKKTILILLCIFSIATLFSQDLIITNDGDSLNCKITQVDAENIYFTLHQKEEIKNNILNKSQINKFAYNYFQNYESSYNSVKPNKPKFSCFDIYVNGGFSYLTSPISDKSPEFLNDFYKELNSGNHFGGGIGIYFFENIGIGARINQFKSSKIYEKQIGITNLQTGIRKEGTLSENIKTIFIGGSINTRIFDANKKNSFTANISFGQISYKNEGEYVYHFEEEGKCFGIQADFGGDFNLNENISFVVQISYLKGALSEVTEEFNGVKQTLKFDKENKYGMNRIDISAGFKLKL